MNLEWRTTLQHYRQELASELEAILHFWMRHGVDEAHGGFIGTLDHNNRVQADAPKGSVLNSRILWTFSAAACQDGRPRYREMAHRVFAYLEKHFVDPENGGVYWSVTAEGAPLDTKKQVYALAFAVYAFSEYHQLTGDTKAKDMAIALFRVIEQYSLDPVNGGYLEALTRDWRPLGDLRLSAKDANEKKSMNTHLHVLEGYTNLYRIWPDVGLKKQIEALVCIFLHNIIHPQTHHLMLFFDEHWASRSTGISYGHDIEAGWLVQEAAELVGDAVLRAEVKKRSLLLAEAAARGLDADGGLWYEVGEAGLVKEKHWWPQAEAMVGFFNAWQLGGNLLYLQHSVSSWNFVKAHILDRERGEWVWGLYEDYSLMDQEDKIGLWKCPYHNGRACLELIRRIDKMDL